jgi:hypothetical protein
VQELYRADGDLKDNQCVGLFHAFLFFYLADQGSGRFNAFRHWVKGNHLAAMQSTDANALIDIFDRVHTAKSRTVFVSMQFGQDTDAIFETIKKTISQINQTCRPKIEIEPLRIDHLTKGHSYTITEEILDAIENCGLVIADLTFSNANVYHEVGYLMGLNKARTGRQDNFILLVRDDDTATTGVGFNLRGISQIRFKETIELEWKLTVEIEKYYGLTE